MVGGGEREREGDTSGDPLHCTVALCGDPGNASTMVNAWMVVTTLVVSVLVILMAIYFVVFFSSDEDKSAAWFPKVLTVLGISFALFLVLLLPLDVSNRSLNGGFDMENLWLVIYITVAVLVVAVFPFAIFYYEAQEENKTCCNQICTGLVYSSILIAAFGVAMAIGYTQGSTAEIPYQRLPPATSVSNQETNESGQIFPIQVSVSVYIIAMIAFLGWMVFIIFAGVGISALPMDFLNDFRKRVKKPTPEQIRQHEHDRNDRVRRLLESAGEIDKMPEGRQKRKMKRLFEQAVYVLTQEEEQFKRDKNASALLPFVKLFAGILFVGLSISWILHIILYNITDETPFLNTFFVKMDSAFALFGIIGYGLWTFYLMWCVIKGQTRFGLQIPLCCKIYPLQRNNTLMNAFLFNTALMLLSATVVVQFAANSFSVYTNQTAVNSLFGTYIENLQGIRHVWPVYLYIWLGFAGLSFLYLLICPRKAVKKVDVDDILAAKHIFKTNA